MKKTMVIIVNVFIMIAMLIFVVLYSNTQSQNTAQRQIEHFENTTIAMERVTENYLEGEQRICDVWARYINSRNMTIDESLMCFLTLLPILCFLIRCPGSLQKQGRTPLTITAFLMRGCLSSKMCAGSLTSEAPLISPVHIRIRSTANNL